MAWAVAMNGGAYVAPCSGRFYVSENIGTIYAFKMLATDLMGGGEETHEVVMAEVMIFVVGIFCRNSEEF